MKNAAQKIKKSRKVWILTDTHFGHKRLVEWGRPWDFEAMIAHHCASIQDEDLVIHLGDVCMGSDERMFKEYVQPIKGRKVLVRGNHDNKTNSWYLEHGFDFVCDSFVIEMYGKRVEFSHKPQLKREGIDMNIHGHWHGNDHRAFESIEFYDDKYHKQVAMEWSGYKPIEVSQKLVL